MGCALGGAVVLILGGDIYIHNSFEIGGGEAELSSSCYSQQKLEI
jgi:hypothetical protein